MPITGRTLGEAAEQFRQHINGVLSRTITAMPMVLLQVRRGFQLSFRQAGQPSRAQLDTRVGRMWLQLSQTCDSVEKEGGTHRLRTLRYNYSLWPEAAEEAVFRWEYVREPGSGLWCRHHIQGPFHVGLNRHITTLNELHVPTGYVPFEEIIRFCIVDLEVPALSGDWHAALQESYREFREVFTPGEVL